MRAAATFKPGLLNSHDRGLFDTVPVGSFPEGASPYGVLDAAGQVYEWTSTSPAPGQDAANAAPLRAIRGRES